MRQNCWWSSIKLGPGIYAPGRELVPEGLERWGKNEVNMKPEGGQKETNGREMNGK